MKLILFGPSPIPELGFPRLVSTDEVLNFGSGFGTVDRSMNVGAWAPISAKEVLNFGSGVGTVGASL